ERLTVSLVGPPTGTARPALAGMAQRVDSVSSLVRGFVHTFLSWPDEPASFMVLVVSAAATVVAVIAGRRGDGDAAVVFVAVAGGCWLLRMAVWPDHLATGLLLAFPI